ncbi:MAG: hypothetical protein Q8O37_13045 [Sulfuricellaceae bacterium]|nr:hypothetical protein [Sulfuricellaceae bacterium]
MLDFLPFGRKKPPTDPLGTIKAATVWMNDLPMGDTFAAHEQVVTALSEFNEKSEAFSKERLKVLMHLDEGAQALQQSLTLQYIINPRMSKQVESRLWNAVFSMNWQLARGYHTFIMAYVGDPNHSEIRNEIPLITARAIRHFAMQAKWHYFRYEAIGPKLWKHVNNLYRLAEYDEFDQKPVQLYPQCQRQTTGSEEYLQLLSLHVLNTNSLFPKQIEMADMWLDLWAGSLRLDKGYDPERHVFCVDLGADKGPYRARKPLADDKLRSWGTKRMMEIIAGIQKSLQAGEIPAKLGLGEDCRLPTCLEFLDRVSEQWSRSGGGRLRRKQERVSKVKLIDVVKDFREVCTLVRHDNEALSPRVQEEEQKAKLTYEEMLDVRLYGFVTERTQKKAGTSVLQGQQSSVPTAHHERWVMENESEFGFGATVEEVKNDWVRLGKLIGLKPERSHHWVIGVVRRLALLDTGQRNVGIEVLGKSPVSVMLKATKPRNSGFTVNGVDAVNVVLPVQGLYLSSNQETKTGVSVILDSSEYSPGRHFDMQVRSRSYSITMGKLIEKGDDWVRASFDVQKKP